MKKNYTVKLKRKRNLKTDYKKRLELIKSNKIRLVIRRSSKTILTQLTKYEIKGDKTLLLIKSQELKKLGWKNSTRNIQAAYLTGLLLGTKAKKLKIDNAIADLGLQKLTKNSVIYAALHGVIDSGLKVPHNKKILLPKEKINKKETEKEFDEVKNKILKNE